MSKKGEEEGAEARFQAGGGARGLLTLISFICLTAYVSTLSGMALTLFLVCSVPRLPGLALAGTDGSGESACG